MSLLLNGNQEKTLKAKKFALGSMLTVLICRPSPNSHGANGNGLQKIMNQLNVNQI